MTTSPWTPPPLQEVQELHERYLREVVIGRNVCPFAQRSIDQNRVTHLWWSQPSRAQELPAMVERFGETVAQSDLDIVLPSLGRRLASAAAYPNRFTGSARLYNPKCGRGDVFR